MGFVLPLYNRILREYRGEIKYCPSGFTAVFADRSFADCCAPKARVRRRQELHLENAAKLQYNKKVQKKTEPVHLAVFIFSRGVSRGQEKAAEGLKNDGHLL